MSTANLDPLAILAALGCPFTIAEPPELRDALRRLAAKIAAQLSRAAVATRRSEAAHSHRRFRSSRTRKRRCAYHYPIVCNSPGHKAAEMVARLTIR